jgi:hypothetical protein
MASQQHNSTAGTAFWAAMDQVVAIIFGRGIIIAWESRIE